MSKASEPFFLYVLIANEKDQYAEMAATSMATLRATNKNAKIKVLTDCETDRLQTPAMRYLRNSADDIVVEKCDYDTPLLRSRHLKLSCRNILKGDFVYLDLDTLISRDLSEFVAHRSDFAAVQDRTGPTEQMVEQAARKGWVVPKQYFNSGVFGVHDTPAMHSVFEDAYALWLEASKDGFGWDQIPFNVAFHRSKEAQVEFLSQSYNAQIQIKSYAAIRPHIFHIFGSHTAEYNETVLRVITKKFKETGSLDEDMIASFVATGNPWVKLSRPGQYIALGRPVSALGATFNLIADRLKGSSS